MSSKSFESLSKHRLSEDTHTVKVCEGWRGDGSNAEGGRGGGRGGSSDHDVATVVVGGWG